jgi:hypothetical protein
LDGTACECGGRQNSGRKTSGCLRFDRHFEQAWRPRAKLSHRRRRSGRSVARHGVLRLAPRSGRHDSLCRRNGSDRGPNGSHLRHPVIELARFATDGVEQMPNAYVEALPKGRPERSAIEHFGGGSPGPRARSFKSQQEAIAPTKRGPISVARRKARFGSQGR